jgi:hypothetical protein
MMNLSRNGKIARLPKAVREELNLRLDNGGQGEPLLNLKVLGELCHRLVALRRGDHRAARLKLEQDRLDLRSLRS